MSLTSFGQTSSTPNNIDTTFFHFSPKEKHCVVNGCALGLSIHPWSTWEDSCFVKLNGLNVELGPLGLVGGIYGTFFGLVGYRDTEGNVTSFFSNYGYSDSSFHVKYGTFVNGLSISIGGLSETFNKGLIINGLSGYAHKTSGVQISGLLNETYEFNGVTIACIGNVTNKAKGVQIGLFNKCNTGQIFQIGLINRIGKRVMPILNFRFTKD